MAARDLNGTMSIVADDYVIVGGDDGITRSAQDTRGYWSKEFSDLKSLPCVRKPQSIEVGQSSNVLRAAERGQWPCPETTAAGDAVYYGSYFAHWSKRAGNWRVVSDNYVTLGCRGRGCLSE